MYRNHIRIDDVLKRSKLASDRATLFRLAAEGGVERQSRARGIVPAGIAVMTLPSSVGVSAQIVMAS